MVNSDVKLFYASDFGTDREITLPVVPGLSAYEETFRTVDGLPVVRHVLTLGLDPVPIRDRLTASWFERLATEGVVAFVDGKRVGWSEKFATEQALRLTAAQYESDKKPLNRLLTLTFTSEDTSPSSPSSPSC